MECSRPGASAVALWATQRLLPLKPGGELAQGLSASRRAALRFAELLRADPNFVVPFDPELDIVVWKLNAEDKKLASERAHRVFDACATRDLHLALVELPLTWFEPSWLDAKGEESGTVTCLRSVLMKPEHEAWLNSIWERLTAACADVL